MYFPIFKLHSWRKRFTIQTPTIYLEHPIVDIPMKNG